MNQIIPSESISRWTLIIIFIIFLSILLLCPTQAADTSQYQSRGVNKTLEAITFMVCILIMKVTALVLGYLIVKLGHDTLIRGVTGDIDFGFEGKGIATKLKAGSPGAFFVLAGAAIIMWALFVEKPFEYGRVKETTGIEQEEGEKSEINRLPEKDRPKTKRD
jgi:hypothetical protein